MFQPGLLAADSRTVIPWHRAWLLCPDFSPCLFLLIEQDMLSSICSLLLSHINSHGFCACDQAGITQILSGQASLCADRCSQAPEASSPVLKWNLCQDILGAKPGWRFSWAVSGCLAGCSRQLAASNVLRLSLLSRVSELTTVAVLVDLL